MKNVSQKLFALALVIVVGLSTIACGFSVNIESTPGKNVTIDVFHKDGSNTEYTFVTSEETLGDLITKEDVAKGEDGAYGLFVTEVDGEKADESNQEWWCITKDGKALNTGVSDTKLSDGDSYEFTLTVGY